MTTQTISRDEAMRRLFSDRRLALSTLLEIENKERILVPFQLNPIQDDMISSSGARDVYVKPGQIGATSVHVGDFFLDNVTINGTVSVIISYDDFSAQRLLLKAKKFHWSLQRRIPTIPKLDHKSATELSWYNKSSDPSVPDFYSTMYIFSARSYVIGRGETIHNLLLDEHAFWPVGTHEVIFASAVQRVPTKRGTKIRIQSTANGEDNPFCEVYRAAKEGTSFGASVYKHHFYEWYLHPEYEMLPDDPFALDGDHMSPLANMDTDEITLYKRFRKLGMDDYRAQCKLRWRRYKKAEMASLRRSGETILIFEQEYPEDDVSCFITAGDEAYPHDIIAQKLRECYPGSDKPFVNPKTGVAVEAQIWEPPEDGIGYIMSIDPGKGKTSESVAQIWRFLEAYTSKDGDVVPAEMRHCATLSGWYDEWEMAQYCIQFGEYYNWAVACPEDNLDIVSHLREYPELYYREDPRNQRIGRQVGWQTNVQTKPYMITELNRHIEEIISHDRRFWSQCRNIRRDPTSRVGISVVGADDHHDAGAIAIVCRDAARVDKGFVGTAGWSDNWGRL